MAHNADCMLYYEETVEMFEYWCSVQTLYKDNK